MDDLSNMKIMVVDDEELIRIHLSRHLTRLGASLQLAENGSEALDMVEQEAPDIILMDVKMPVMDGLEATRRLKENQDTAGIPVIMLSAKAQNSEIDNGYACKADSYLTKPATLNQILDEIRKHT